MALFDSGEIVQELANLRVLRLRGGVMIETIGFGFTHLHFAADRIDRQIADEPDRAPLDEAAHIVAADRQDIGAEFLLIGAQQRVMMRRLDLGHALEHCRGRRITIAQILGKGHIDAMVVILGIDRDGENFPLVKLRKVLQGNLLF